MIRIVKLPIAMDIKQEREITRLINRARALRKEMDDRPLSAGQLCELYGIYSILIRLQLASVGQ